jgi:Ca-activated chloride channel homolog
MKIELQLDYKTILRNSSRPVHLVAKLTAPAQPLTLLPRPTAFTVALDRSGSMSGAPIEHAKQACREVIKNLRAGGLLQFGRVRHVSSGRDPFRKTG